MLGANIFFSASVVLLFYPRFTWIAPVTWSSNKETFVRVLMISKACVVGMYQRKLEELARFPDVELCLAVPPYWRDGRRTLPLEKEYTSGYELHVLPMILNGHFHLHFYRGLGRFVRRLRPDIVHIDEEPYNLATFQAMRIARQTGARALFFTWQNLLRRYPFPFRFFERYNLTHAACAIAGNHEAVEVLRTKGCKRPIYLLPQFGVDPDVYHKERPSSRQDTEFVIGYAGRLVEEKGVQVLVRAVAGLDGQWTLCLIGDGPYRAPLQALSKQLGIEQRVLFEHWMPSREMPRLLNGLDALVMPSLTRRNWKEQFGRALVEAMACEVPVVGSSSGEIPNVIADAGLIFPEGDSGELRAVLSKLMDNPSLRTQLGRRGRARVLEHYTQKRIAAQTYAIYRQLLHGQASDVVITAQAK
jgi:glycosyltransferase involved in cell wall biosynthesis